MVQRLLHRPEQSAPLSESARFTRDWFALSAGVLIVFAAQAALFDLRLEAIVSLGAAGLLTLYTAGFTALIWRHRRREHAAEAAGQPPRTIASDSDPRAERWGELLATGCMFPAPAIALFITDGVATGLFALACSGCIVGWLWATVPARRVELDRAALRRRARGATRVAIAGLVAQVALAVAGSTLPLGLVVSAIAGSSVACQVLGAMIVQLRGL